MTRTFVSRPSGKCSYDNGSYSTVFPTRNSGVLVYCTNSLYKIEWLQHLGVTLDRVEQNYRGYAFAVSVRLLKNGAYIDSCSRWAKILDSDMEAIATRENKAKDKWPTPSKQRGEEYEEYCHRLYKVNFARGRYLLQHLDEFSISADAFRWAEQQFNGYVWLSDASAWNYMVCPVTGVVFPYDVLNFNYFEECVDTEAETVDDNK